MCQKNEIEESLYFRHACKHFDSSKKIPEDDLNFILNAGRLAPSSFGMEPWRFLVIRNQKLKEELKPLCWNQNQITECSDLVVIIGEIESVQNPEYYSKMFKKKGLPQKDTEAYIQKYEEYISNLHSISGWVSKQCYIAADHMMVYASLIEIDSCPIEGFEPRKVDKLLGLDRKKERSVLLLPLGYRVNPAPKKQRREFEEVVSFIE